MQMMYTGLANCFCAERTLAWSRNQLLTIVNLAGLPIAVSPNVPTAQHYLVAVFGIIMSIFWHFVNTKMRSRINYWQDRLAQMETMETSILAFRAFTGKVSDTIRKAPRIYAINLLPWMFFCIWAIILVAL